jgi:hypothetical protein
MLDNKWKEAAVLRDDSEFFAWNIENKIIRWCDFSEVS